MEAKKSKDALPQKTNYSKKSVQEMSWSQCLTLAKQTAVFLVPYGSISKEHGHHLPQDTDYRQAIKLTECLADQLEKEGINYLITPPIGYSFYPSFDLYPGSINLDKETSAKIVIDYCQAYAKTGCKKFYIVNTGVSTIAVLKDVQAELIIQGIEIDFFSYKKFNEHLPTELVKMEQGIHAGALETSLMLALDPDCVDMSKAEDNDVPDIDGPLYPSWNQPSPNPSAPGIASDSGVWGAATKATKEIGEKIIATFCPYALSEVQALISPKPSPLAQLYSFHH